jgi:hypothetical protein
MPPVPIVVVQPGRQGGLPLQRTGVGATIGPLAQQGLNEALRLAVGPGRVGAGAPMGDAQGGRPSPPYRMEVHPSRGAGLHRTRRACYSLGFSSRPILSRELECAKKRIFLRHCGGREATSGQAGSYFRHEVSDEQDTSATNRCALTARPVDEEPDLSHGTGKYEASKQPGNVLSACLELLSIPIFTPLPAICI